MAHLVNPLSVPRAARLCLLLAALMGLSGCTVLAVVDTAASAVVGVAGLAVDAAVGTARIAGKAVGAAADAVTPDAKP